MANSARERTADLEFNPDYRVPPAESLQETLEVLGVTPAELAERTGLSVETVDLLLSGDAPIGAEVAARLERVLGTLATFWLNLERAYREDAAESAELNSEWDEVDAEPGE